MKSNIKKKPILSEESFEKPKATVTGAFQDVGKDVMKNFWDQFLKGTADAASVQMFNENIFTAGAAHHEDMQEGQEVMLKKAEKKAEHRAQHNREYFVQDVDRDPNLLKRQEQAVLEQQIEQILVELKQLIKASSEMQTAFKEIETENVPVEAGTYHIHFFEWVLSVVRGARQKVEDSGSWLSTSNSKKKQKGYWNQFKKHGTSFALSSERNVATQVG